MGLKDLSVSILLIGIVAFLAILFAYDMQVANNQVTILDNNETATLKGNLGSSFGSYADDSQNISGIYYNTTMTPSAVGIPYTPSQNVIQTTSWKTPFLVMQNLISYTYTTLVGTRGQEFAWLSGSVAAIVLIVVVFYFIRFVRQGQE